ncbi:glycosyltransferase family 2 protein [Trichocoleus sp. FACHB-591]|uniref:glycosyltransferase family 2 protein n=1 Tax=Trichocoleus sp. FACHB-591 TaxID=2692872 RepID=UPI001688B769|nr:glycosyltransferase family 2 protein [Trichocoleus sp. FACHB-591]MBD2096307.1 glycosyltransferase family 2 protein [Trichocoleus sp. FACHB-591]
MKKPVFIIIPAHNRKSVTLKCLENLEQNGDLDRYYAIVIDDGSTDGTGAAISAIYPDVILLRGDGNLWWTGAISKGMDYAQQKGAEFIIWLNDDCITEETTLRLLVEHSRKNQGVITGSACYVLETNTLYESGAKGRRPVMARPSEVVDVDEMSGHCVCFSTHIIENIGLPDAHRFPHYHGDSMYILKATRAGFSACILGDARIYHSGGVKSKIQDFLNLVKPNASLSQALKQFFFNKKSLYYCPTQFFYNTEKYGFWRGAGLFSLKSIQWLVKWSWLIISQPKKQQKLDALE